MVQNPGISRRKFYAILRSQNFMEIYRKNTATQSRDAYFVRAYTIEIILIYYKSHPIRKFVGGIPQPKSTAYTSRNAYQHVTRTPFYENLQEKCRSPKRRRILCASLRDRNAFQHVTKAILYGNLQEKCPFETR